MFLRKSSSLTSANAEAPGQLGLPLEILAHVLSFVRPHGPAVTPLEVTTPPPLLVSCFCLGLDATALTVYGRRCEPYWPTAVCAISGTTSCWTGTLATSPSPTCVRRSRSGRTPLTSSVSVEHDQGEEGGVLAQVQRWSVYHATESEEERVQVQGTPSRDPKRGVT